MDSRRTCLSGHVFKGLIDENKPFICLNCTLKCTIWWSAKSSTSINIFILDTTLGKIMGKFCIFLILFSKWANYSSILITKMGKFWENTIFSVPFNFFQCSFCEVVRSSRVSTVTQSALLVPGLDQHEDNNWFWKHLYFWCLKWVFVFISALGKMARKSCIFHKILLFFF